MLLTPGPVPVPEYVLDALRRPVMHHRSAEFRTFYAEVQAGLRYFFQTEGLTGTYFGSGTYGVEMAMASFFQPGEKVLVLDFGKFSGRWVEFGQQIGLEVVPLTTEWGQSPDLASLEALAARHPDLRGVVFTHSETSTGALIDLEEMAFALRRSHPEALLVVDAITSVGALPYYHDAWDLDFSLTASQKSLMNPAGVVAFASSERAAARLQPTFSGDYRNLHHYVRLAREQQFPFTAPTQLLYGIHAVLQQVRATTLPAIWNRNQAAARQFRAALAPLGAEVFPAVPSSSLTAFTWPQQDLAQVQQQLQEAHGFYLAGGQGHLKGKILRVSHLSELPEGVMDRLLRAMNQVRFV